MPELQVSLRESLAPVAAPYELWVRLHTPREPRRAVNALAWGAASAVLVMASVVGLHAQLKNPAVKQPLQTWAKTSAGLDLHGACGLCHID